ncbi:MAG: peptidylprolyl isomerase [Saprospiraceae bacterium]|nr:peptidylprolyl isomerase [Saprospiraceae bacterium]
MRFSCLLLIFLITACSSPRSVFTIESKENVAPATVTFHNLSTKADDYLWDFGDGNTSKDKDPVHKYVLSGKYQVSLKAINENKVNMSHQEIIVDAPHHCLVELTTTAGHMTIQLYDETPLHRDNFIKLAEEGFYEDITFHRVIEGFMIQAGDPESKGNSKNKKLGSGGNSYTITAEFNPKLIHTKGALAAARTGDNVNPKKESSGSQFYIVHGKPQTDKQLENYELQKGIKYSADDINILKTLGGAPALDMEYTVFGRVIKGLEVIDKIAESQTDKTDRPVEDIRILSLKIIK